MKKSLGILCCLFTATLCYSQEDSTSGALSEFIANNTPERVFEYQYGIVELDNGLATITVPEGFSFLDAEQSSYVLTKLWGNPPSEVLGLMFPDGETPTSESSTYAVELSYSKDGYIEDEDAEDIDYDDLLEEMQGDVLEANTYRRENGYEEVELISWASPPFYDKEAKKLHWAKELKFGSTELNTLNYNIRILGRKGYLNLNIISDMEQVHTVKNDVSKILGCVEFNEGSRYIDFDPDIDEIAAYGIGGLIAGKLLAKAGFFVVFLKFWKVIALAVVGGFATIKKMFFGSKKED